MNRKRKESNTSTPPKRKKVRLSKKVPKRKKKTGNLKEDSEYNDSSDSSKQGSTQDHFSKMNIGQEDIDDDSVNRNLEEPACDANPITQAYLHNIKNNTYHPNNSTCISLNVIMVCKRHFLGENKPREDNDINHYQDLKELNKHLLDWDYVSTTDVHEFRLFLWNSLTEEFKSTAMHWVQEQLMKDLMRQDIGSKYKIENFQDVMNWHGSIEGATMDEVAWRSKYRVFDNNKRVNDKIQQTKSDWGIHYESEAWTGFFESLFNYSKRMIFKNIDHRREIVHGKKLSITQTNNRVKKKSNPQEHTIKKRKKGEFDASLFISFKDDVQKNQFNLFAKKHGQPDCQVDVARVTPAEKPLPKVPRQ